MKLKVLKRFHDKINGITREVGEVFEADEKRAKELIAHEMQLVERVAESKPKARTAKKSD